MNGSNDISSLISKLTENPEMMKSLMGIAGNLMNSEGEKKDRDISVGRFENDGDGHNRENERDTGRESKSQNCDECENGRGKHGKRGDDAENLIRLLLALKPYVSPERCEKIDSIVKILKLVQLSEKTGLLKSLL